MKIFSIVTNHRSSKDSSNSLRQFFESIVEKTSNLDSIELIIKMDDDQDLSASLAVIKEFQNKFEIRYVINSRAGGYIDLHKHYLDLLINCSAETKFVWPLTDDIKISKKNWDLEVLEKSKEFKDEIFVINTESFNHKIASCTINEALQVVDRFPLWSKKWIEIQGFAGYQNLVDGWTSLTLWRLFHKYGFLRAIDMSQNLIEFSTDQNDGFNSDKWNNSRREVMEKHLSPTILKLLEANVDNLAFNIINAKNSNLKLNEEYNKLLVASVLDSYDKSLSFFAKNSLDYKKTYGYQKFLNSGIEFENSLAAKKSFLKKLFLFLAMLVTAPLIIIVKSINKFLNIFFR